jgi:hypothetical protein
MRIRCADDSILAFFTFLPFSLAVSLPQLLVAGVRGRVHALPRGAAEECEEAEVFVCGAAMATARVAAPRAADAGAASSRVSRAAASPAPWAALRAAKAPAEELWRRARAAAGDASFLRDTAPTVLRVRAALPETAPPPGTPPAATYALGALAAAPPPARLGLRRRPLVVPFSSGAALTLALAGGPLPLRHVTLRLAVAAALPGAAALRVLKAAPAGEWDARRRTFTWRIERMEAHAPPMLLRLHIAARRGGGRDDDDAEEEEQRADADADAPSQALCAEMSAEVDTTAQKQQQQEGDASASAADDDGGAKQDASSSCAPLSRLALAARLRDGREGCVRVSAAVRAAVFASPADARQAVARVTASTETMPTAPLARAPAPAEQAPPAADDGGDDGDAAPPSSASSSSAASRRSSASGGGDAPPAAEAAVAADVDAVDAAPPALAAAAALPPPLPSPPASFSSYAAPPASPTPSPSPSAPSSPASPRSHISRAGALSSTDGDGDGDNASSDNDDHDGASSSDEEGDLTSPPATPRSLGAREAAPPPSAGAPLPATALFDFDAAADDAADDVAEARDEVAREMSVRAGDALWVTSDAVQGWVMARHARSGDTGLVPAAYLAIEPS